MGQRILLVEDEPALARMLTDFLTAEGYSVQCQSDGETGLAAALADGFDLILLDWMLPGKSGLDVCHTLRQSGSSVPILMLTGRGQTADKVVGLRSGADDYITKPFDLRELAARVEALLRRGPAASPISGDTYQFGDIDVDLRRAEVRKRGNPVPLSTREFQLLRYLVSHRGEVLPRSRLVAEVWRQGTLSSTRTVDVHVAWLRQKLEENPRRPQLILTVRGSGYKFAG